MVLVELFKKANSLKFFEWVDQNTGGVLTFIKGENFNDMDDLKQMLKALNLDYPNDIEEKLSTTKISSKDLHRHIDWCIRLAGENGIEFEFVENEWARLLEQAYNYGG